MPNPKAAKSMTNKPLEDQKVKKNEPARKEANATPQGTPAVDADALARGISQSVIEKISTMMENKFEELSTTLNSITTRLGSNTKRSRG